MATCFHEPLQTLFDAWRAKGVAYSNARVCLACFLEGRFVQAHVSTCTADTLHYKKEPSSRAQFSSQPSSASFLSEHLCPQQAVVQEGRISAIGLLASDRTACPFFRCLATGHRRRAASRVGGPGACGGPAGETTCSFSQVPQAFAHLQRVAFGKIAVQVSEG
jgi:hypothetical protein